MGLRRPKFDRTDEEFKKLDSPRCWPESEAVHQHPRKLGTLSFLLVFEIDEDIAARRGLTPDGVRPAGDVVWGVSLIPEAEVRVIRGQPDRRGHPLAVGHAQREVALRQERAK